MDYNFTKDVIVDKLQSEILAASLPLTSISALGSALTVTMSRTLITAEVTTLNTVVTNHVASGWTPLNDSSLDVVNFTEQTTPTTPTVGLKIFSDNVGGRQMLSQVGKSGVDYSFQPLLGKESVSFVKSIGNSTSFTSVGVSPSTSGTATSRAVANTSIFSLMKKTGFVSSSIAGSSAGLRANAAQNMIGSSNGFGGFLFIARFGISDAAAVATGRLFAGLLSSASVIGSVEPSTLTNMIGVGADSTDTTLQIMFNDGTGTATKVALPATFPVNTRNIDMFELVIYVKPNGTSFGIEVTNLTTGDVYNYSATTNIPANTTLLSWQLWRNNATTALAVGLDIASVYIETDN